MASEGDKLLAVGLSHATAPVEIRERLALDHNGIRTFLSRLHSNNVVREAMLLSTCNRVELYSVPQSMEAVRESMAEFRGPAGERIDKYLYWYKGREAVLHLFRVASSLDSMVLGEPQILGQVKDAVRVAEESSSVGRLMQPLLRHTLSVAKRVRTETDLGRSRVGIGNAGVDLALQIFGELSKKRAMLIGTGDMGQQVAQALLSSGLAELLVTNRSPGPAAELAAEKGGTAVPYERMSDYLGRVDIVIAATGATTPIVSPAAVRAALKRRRYHPLFLVDLSVPRNIDPAVDDLDEAYLFNIDDLQQVVSAGRQQRAAAAEHAQRLVLEETDRFMASLRALNVGPDLARMTRFAERLRQKEVERSRRLIDTLDDDQRAALDAMTRAMVKRLLHQPLKQLRDAARRGDADTMDLIRSLWEDEDT